SRGLGFLYKRLAVGGGARVARAGGYFAYIGENSVKVVDNYTVDITPVRPNMRLVECLTHPLFGMVAPGSDPGKAPVCTGPFKFVSYEKGVRLVVERNPNYWGTPARLERITFKFIPDNATKIMALQAGEVDMITTVPKESVARLKSDKGTQILTSSPGAYTAIYFTINGKKPFDLLSDRKLRLALAVAVDRDSIINKIWEGNAEVNQTVIPPVLLGSEKTKIQGFVFEPDRAKKMLEEAGWKEGPDGIRIKDGQKLSLTLVSGFPSAEIHKPLPEVIQSQLRDVGVNVKIVEAGDTGVYYDLLKEGKGDMWLETGSQNIPDPTFLPEMIFHSKGSYSEEYHAIFAPGGEFERLIDEARSTPDPAEAVRLTAEAMHVLIDDDVAVMPIAANYNIFAFKEKVKGIEPHPSRLNTSWTGIFIK
ncbi:MAG: ABC transporter substrate-binding protein, partial [Firmicutes bacterium]|nr:ABC transporter substrate-binding protein [Bacillota bacterium]